MHEERKQLDIIDLLSLIASRRRFIAVFVFATCLATGIVALVTEPSYTADVTLMPPEAAQSGLLALLPAGLPFGDMLGSTLGGMGDASGVYLSILSSRWLRTSVADHFDLVHVYKIHKRKVYFIEDILLALDRHVGAEVTNEGTLVIYVEDKSPERAAQMAEFMVSMLDSIYSSRIHDRASQKRMFLGERLGQVKVELAAAEDSLIAFQVQNKAVHIDAQAGAAIEAAAKAEALYQTASLEYDIGQKLLSPDHPQQRELKLRMGEIKRHAERLTNSRVSSLLIPLTQAPHLALEMARLMRNAKIQEAIFELLTQQFEQARIEEASTVPHVQVLDPALPPQKRSSPKRTKMVLIAFAISTTLAVFVVLLHNAVASLRTTSPLQYRKLEYVMGQIPGLAFIRRLAGTIGRNR